MTKKEADKKLTLNRETLRMLSIRQLNQVLGGSDNSQCYCPGDSDPNSCVAECGI